MHDSNNPNSVKPIDPIKSHMRFSQCLGYALGRGAPDAFRIAKAAAKLLDEADSSDFMFAVNTVLLSLEGGAA